MTIFIMKKTKKHKATTSTTATEVKWHPIQHLGVPNEKLPRPDLIRRIKEYEKVAKTLDDLYTAEVKKHGDLAAAYSIRVRDLVTERTNLELQVDELTGRTQLFGWLILVAGVAGLALGAFAF